MLCRGPFRYYWCWRDHVNERVGFEVDNQINLTLLTVKAEFSGSSGGGFHKVFNAKNLLPSPLDHAILTQAMLLLESELLTVLVTSEFLTVNVGNIKNAL